MKNHYGKWLVSIILICCVGCTRREICEFEHPHKGNVNFLFDWQKLLPETIAPDSMHVRFYPAATDTVIEGYCVKEGIGTTLLADSYCILVINRGVSELQFRNMDRHETAEVYFPENINVPVSRSLNTVGQAEPFYGVSVDGFMVEPDGEHLHKLVMQPYVKRLKFDLKIDGLFQAVACAGSLTGLAASLNLSSGNVGTASDPVTAVFPLVVSGGQVTGVLFILGINPGTTRGAGTNLLTLDFILGNGVHHIVNLDITGALGHIVDGDIEIKIEVQGNEVNGLTASVKAWETGGEVTVVVK